MSCFHAEEAHQAWALERYDGDHRGTRYLVKFREGEAYIAITHREEGIITADHTVAPDSLKGTGAAFALVEYLVADARARDFTIIPYCPYVRAQYRKHPEWADAFAVPPEWEPAAG